MPKKQRRTLTRRDWMLAGGVSLLVFGLFHAVAAFRGWWYQDAPFPAPVLAQQLADAAAPSDDGIAPADLGSLDAQLRIASLGIDIPVVWSESRNEEDLQRDLERGAIHYPGTAFPGDLGNAFLSAHSSNYPWKSGEYARAFARLGQLNVGDEHIFITYRKNGAVVRELEFRVAEKAVVRDTDPRLFASGEKQELTLVTCWPVGTRWRRLMIKTELVNDSQQE